MLTASLVKIAIAGGTLVGMWDSQGNALYHPTKDNPPQVFKLRLPKCGPRQRVTQLRVTLGGKTKHYVVECAPEVYLEWHKTKVDPSYRKELIRR